MFRLEEYLPLRDTTGYTSTSYSLDITTLLVKRKEVLQNLNSRRVCLVVNGLDRCVHDFKALLPFIKKLSTPPSAKVKVLILS